jgi:hypothetical protein
MAWTYDPKKASSCLPAGNYEAVLESVEEKVSKNNNPMLEAHWTVFESADRHVTVRDFIVNPATLWKLKNIARAWAMLGTFEAGVFDLQEHLQKHITVVLDLQNSEKYGEQNSIVGYLEPPSAGFNTPMPARASVETGPEPKREEEIPW